MRVVLRFVLAGCALASSGCVHAQTGPIIGYAPAQGVMVGWEGGAGAAPLSATIGAEIRPFGDRVSEVYIAAEPALAFPLEPDSFEPGLRGDFLSVGVSGGFAVDEHNTGSWLAGGWLALSSIGSGDCRARWVSAASISFGIHVFADGPEPQWTLYASPKLGTLGDCPDPRVPLGPGP